MAGEGTQVSFVVHPQGGTTSMNNVPVRFYVGAPGLTDPATPASLIGDGTIASLALKPLSIQMFCIKRIVSAAAGSI